MKYGQPLHLTTLVLLTLVTGKAWASSLTIDSFATNTDNPVIDTAPSVLITQTGGNNLSFSVSTPNANGLLSAVFIDVAGNPSFAAMDLSTQTAGVSIEDFEEDTNSIGNGNARSLNGNFDFGGAPQASGNFDIGFGFDDGDNGGGGRQIDLPFEFTLSGVLLGDIERIGLRFQSVGTLGSDGTGDGSERLISTTVVPVPAAAWLFISGLAGLFGFKRYKAAWFKI